MILRRQYLDKLLAQRERQLIKVLTGVRRCGKSTLFHLYIKHLQQTGVTSDQIIYINLESLEHEDLYDYKSLYHYITSRLCNGKYTYIFIDEVQLCTGFEKAVNSLFIKDFTDIYITGSNAHMLSGELATLLAGRYINIHILPLSFAEYYSYTRQHNADSLDVHLQNFMRYGAFPYLAVSDHAATAAVYLEGIYNTILIKDIAQRSDISDISLLENIIKTVASSIGSPISTKKISDTLNSSGRKISTNTVDRYLKALTDSYIFYNANRYDIKGRQHLKTLGKYYIVDSGLRNLLLAQSSADTGHVLENIVYLELLRRGFTVSIGKLAQKEVDFVASSYENLSYYQVATTVLDPLTLQRELEPLKQIPDNHPKYLLTLDNIGASSQHQGIKQLNLINWLLEFGAV